MTALIDIEALEQTIQLVKDRFHYRGWRSKNIDRYSRNVCMVYRPDQREYCYFITFFADGRIGLLPPEDRESYKEAKSIIKEAMKNDT